MELAKAFGAFGIRLKDPARSRSGVRDDGAVLIAIEQAEVEASAEGFCCLLWTAAQGCGGAGADWPSFRERREHCALAAARGGARGLLVDQGQTLENEELLALRVESRRSGYWAFWGGTARRSRGSARG